MKPCACLALCLFVSIGLANIDRDIATSKDKLATAQSQEKAISKKLDELGKAINAKNAELTQLGKQISALQKDIEQNQGKFLSQEKNLQAFKSKQNALLNQKKNIEKQLVGILAQGVAFYMILQKQAHIDSEEGVLESFMYQTLHQNAKKQVTTLNAKQNLLNNDIKQISSNISQIQNSIKTQTNKKDRLQSAKDAQDLILANMRAELNIYDQKLKDIVKERKSLDEILSRLNIVKEQKQQGESQQAFVKNQKEPNSIKAPKQFGTSYRDVPTISYKGAKTFAPLEQYTIEKKFGPYFDPVYKFKIFNAAVILNPKKSNASVKNVLDGKIVYAKDAPGLKKVIIIEHNNAIHTIYAYLDKIESSIKAGVSVKKGTTIGRVNERLSFEITQKDKHINPAEFITLKN